MSTEMTDSLLQIVYAGFGSLGFSVFFNEKKERLLIASLLGAGTWSIWLLAERLGAPVILCAFSAALAAGAAAEILARVFKAPSTVFCIPGLIPLVPGGGLYYTMEAIVRADYALAAQKAVPLLWTLIGIGAGCGLVIGVMDIRKKVGKGSPKAEDAPERK